MGVAKVTVMTQWDTDLQGACAQLAWALRWGRKADGMGSPRVARVKGATVGQGPDNNSKLCETLPTQHPIRSAQPLADTVITPCTEEKGKSLWCNDMTKVTRPQFFTNTMSPP